MSGAAPFRPARAVGALGVLAALALGACKSTPATPASSLGAPPPNSTSSSTTSAAGPASGTPASGGGGGGGVGVPCRSSQLAVKLIDANRGTVGYTDWLFELRNTSVQDCTMAGYPTIRLLDAAAHPLVTLEERGAGPSLTGRVATTVAVPAGGAAVFGIESYTCTGAAQPQAPAPVLMVTPPGDTAVLQVTVDPAITTCTDGRFVTSPVRSDPSGVAS